MSTVKWTHWNESVQEATAESCGVLMQLCGRMLADAAEAVEVTTFLRRQLGELATELSAQWLSVQRRVPGPDWEEVAVHGRHSLAQRPVQLWDESLEKESAGITQSGAWTVFAVPLDAQNDVGSLLVGATRNPEGDLAVSSLIAAQSLSLALRLAVQRTEMRQQLDRLKSTLDIASRLSSEEEAVPLLELIAREATRLLDCDRSSIFLWDRERNEVEARPALGEGLDALRIPSNEGIVGETLKTNQSIVVHDAYQDPRFNSDVDRQSGYTTRNLICVPLRDCDGSVVGAFEAINRNNDQRFTDEDVECLQQLGTQAAVALRNLRERSILHRTHNELTKQVTSGVAIIGESPAIVALRDTIRRLSHTDLPVLVLGESGTGKEVVAQSLHYNGQRESCPFIAVNCAALTESLLESELFGHEQGAFTDARDMRQGKFELADGGTLFLDEIGDMSLGGQAKLLRVLEQKLITRVGGSQTIPINVRIVAATNANLAESVREKRFREDLYYRLSVVTLDLPPLRERPEDILPLAEYFLTLFARHAKRPNLQLTSEARRRLQAHGWPGNIRELRNLMERVAFLCANDRVDSDDLAFILSPGEEGSKQPALDLGLERATREFQRIFIRRSIKRVAGNMTDAARLLGLHRSNLYRKMKQLKMSEVNGED